MNVATISTVTNATQAAVESITTHGNKQQTTYKIEMLDDSMASDDDDDDLISSDGSMFDENELAQIAVQDDLANQLAAAGPVGVAAAAAIASSKKRKRQHSFETNPSVRKRQQNRLLRKLRGIIYEFTGRVGKQAVVLVATPGKPNTSYKVFGAKPLEDVVRNLKNIVMDELENALAQQAPPPPQEDPSLFELPPLIIDGIPTPVEKMTQAQLRAFIPLMLKYSTGRGKPGWGREATRPPWWPKELPWANVRMDARSEDDKQKISWTHALRKIVINCYKYHGREDLLPTFADEDEKVAQLISHEEEDEEEEEVLVQPVSHNTGTTIQAIHTPNNTTSNVRYTTQTVLSTIQNADGTVSLIQVDPNNPIITLPDGTTAQVQGVATLHQGEGGATIQTVQSLADVNSHENMTVDLTEATVAQDGQIYITAEDGQGYPVSVSNMITVPVSASMYQSMMANIQQIHTNSDGTVCITPMQVDAHHHHNNSSSASNSNNNNSNSGPNSTSIGAANNSNAGGTSASAPAPQYQCYSLMAATPLAGPAAAAAHRFLTNSALGQTQSLVQNLNLSHSSSGSNSSNNSNNNHQSDNSTNSNSSTTSVNVSSTNNHHNQIRCQIINASSLVPTNSSHLNNNTSSSSSSGSSQQHQLALPHHALINQQSLTNVLQSAAAAKVFLAAASPAQLSLTTAAANLLNNNNNDTTTANNNTIMNNNNNGHIKIGTATLPIVVATANPHHHHQQHHPVGALITTANVGGGGGGFIGKHRSSRSSGNNAKSGHKRRKQHTTIATKVMSMKTEEGGSAVDTSCSLMPSDNNDGHNEADVSNTNTTSNATAEGLLNIQIVDTSDNGRGDFGGVSGGGDICTVDNVRVGTRLVSVEVSTATGSAHLTTAAAAKTVKIEATDN